MSRYYLELQDRDGGAPILLDLAQLSSGVFRVTGNLLQALTDAQALSVASPSLANLSSQASEQLLASGVQVDMNVLNGTTGLFTVPAGKSCIPTKVVVRNPSISLTTASYSFGFTSAAFADMVANATHTGLNAAGTAIVLPAIATGITIGAAAAVLTCKVNTAQGAAATALVDVYGYLF